MTARALTDHRADRGLLRAVLRAPIWVYRAGLGGLLGKRFVMIDHVGRKTGVHHQTVLEVVRHDPATQTFIVASGWGEQAHWFQNVLKNPEVKVHSGGSTMDARAERLTPEDALAELRDYAHRHPFAFRKIGQWLLGNTVGTSEQELANFAARIPLVALRPPSIS